MSQPRLEPVRMDGIDQLRGVSILLVLIYHCGALSWRMAQHDPRGWLVLPDLSPLGWLAVPFLHFGFTGVHAFFVLSGFCIHLRGARAHAAGKPAVPSVKTFLLRRFWRIYPPYWIALALFVAGLTLAPRLGLRLSWPPPPIGDVALHATMLHTLDGATFFSINPAFWSLATEEQFYLAYPLLALALSRWGAGRVLVASLALTLAWRSTVVLLLPPTVEHFMDYRVLVHGLFLPRWFDWILGCWLAELSVDPARPLQRWRSRLLPLGALLLFAGMATRVHVVADKLASDALFSSGFAAITGWVLASPGAAPRLLPLRLLGRALSGLGRRAYTVYLVHQPFLDLLALPLALRAAMVAVASGLFYRFCERPFEDRSRRVR